MKLKLKNAKSSKTLEEKMPLLTHNKIKEAERRNELKSHKKDTNTTIEEKSSQERKQVLKNYQVGACQCQFLFK